MSSISRVLFIHAHPDDESLWSGVAIAQRALAGDDVVVLTCTLGEEGEVIPAATRRFELPAGASRQPGDGQALAGLRRHELGAAVATLGARSVLLSDLVERPLRDSGMAGSPASNHPDAFAATPIGELAAAVAQFIDTEQFDEVVSYERHGGYGHPDHIQAHRLACAAVRLSHTKPALFAIVLPYSWATEDRAWVQRNVVATDTVSIPAGDDDYPLNLINDVPGRIFDDRTAAGRQQEALRYHRTQVVVNEGWYMLSNNIALRLAGREALVPMDPATGELR